VVYINLQANWAEGILIIWRPEIDTIILSDDQS